MMSQKTVARGGPIRKRVAAAIMAVSVVMTAFIAGGASAAWDASVGKGIELSGINVSGSLRLGPHINQTASIGGTTVETGPQWCIDGKKTDPGANDLSSIATLTSSSKHVSDLALETPEAAYLLQKYQGNKGDDVNLAALALLMHANFENSASTASEIASAAKSQQPAVYARAKQYVSEAKSSAAVGYEGGKVTGDGKRTGEVHNIGVHPDNANAWISGIPVTVTLSGPAVFDATGTNTWTGTTKTSGITLAWSATGNGDVTYTAKYKTPARRTLTKFGANGAVQDMISYGNRPNSDPEYASQPGPKWKVIFDFQPIATSNVGDSKIVDSTTLTDTITAKADPNYGDGNWLDLDGKNVPVTYVGTAYYTGLTPASTSDSVPADAKELGTVSVDVDGPGEYTATLDVPEVDPNFVTWVWKVVKADQGDYSKYVHADWSDQYGLADETTSVRHTPVMDSNLSIRETKGGTYLVDDLFVTDFPKDHPDFAGGAGFEADVKVMTQTLYFFSDGVNVTDENIDQAEQIASLEIPAKNGFYPSVGATDFKIKGDEPGTYVFVTSFAGDDRVQPLTTSVTDEKEQYVVTPQPPTIKTTATDGSDGDKVLASHGPVTINDNVCYTGLTVGKSYDLRGSLQNAANGTSIVDADSKPVTATSTFTPEAKDGCTDVVFKFDGALIAGQKTVVFEDLYLDGVLVTSHADITDEGQTVETPKGPELSTTATDGKDGDKVVTPDKEVTINDKVCYEGVIPDTEYVVSGTLMDKATKKPVQVNGKDVTASATFTPDKADGCTNVSFTFDGTSLAGHETVVFEDLTKDDVVVATHSDINDKGQTVTFENGGGKGKTEGGGKGLAFTGAQSIGLVAASLAMVTAGAVALVVRKNRSNA